MKKRLTNQGLSLVWGAVALFAYAAPLISVAIVKRDKIFANGTTALTFFSVVLIVLFVIFAKKIVKRICKVLTPLWFGSLVFLLVVLGLRSLLDDLYIIALASLIGSIIAWYPYQLAGVYNKRAYDENGDVIKTRGLTFKEANAKLFQISIVEKENEEEL